MAKKEWGFLCPDGHGLLLEREGWSNLWCPHSDHGGNGRYYQPSETKEGWWDPTRPVVTETTLEKQARAHERAEEFRQLERERERQMAKEKSAARAAKTTAPKAEPKDCLCGCGGQTKGGRFLPGHDARFHARVKTLTGTFGLDHEAAEKLASKGPLTGKYAVKPKAAAASNGAAPKPAPAVETTTEPVDDGAAIEV